VVGVASLILAGLGALFLGGAWDGYLAANPGFRGDVANPPPASAAIGTQAVLALAMLALGYLLSFGRITPFPYGLPPIASVTSSREMPCRSPNS